MRIDTATPAGTYSLGVIMRTGLILFLLYVFANIDRQVMAILVRPMERDLRLNDFEMSLLLGPAFSVLYAIGGLPFGWAADRFPRRWIMFFGAVVWGLSTTLSGLANGFARLMGARIGVGLGEASLTPCAQSTIADMAPRTWLAFAISAYNTGSTIGAAVALIAGGWLVDHVPATGLTALPGLAALRPWQWVFLFTGAPAVLIAPFVLLTPDTRARPTAGEGAGFVALWRFAASRRRALAAAVFGGGGIVLLTQALGAWAPTYMQRAFGMPAAQVGLDFGVLLFVVGTLGHFFVGAVVDAMIRSGVRDAHLRFPVIALLISAPCVAAAFTVGAPWLFLLLVGVFYFVSFPTMGICAATVQLLTPPALRGRTSAAFMLWINLMGSGLAAPAVGLIVTYGFHDPHKLGVAIALVFAAIAPLTVLLLGQGMRQIRTLAETAR